MGDSRTLVLKRKYKILTNTLAREEEGIENVQENGVF
jgi:hypothetical protein